MLKQSKILAAVVLIGLAASLFLVVNRYRSEARNRRVELAVDWDQIRAVSLAIKTPPYQILGEFKKLGVTSVAVTEQTLANLRDAGILDVRSLPGYMVIRTSDRDLKLRIKEYLTVKYGRELVSDDGTDSLEIRATFDQLRDTGIGLPEDDVRQLQSPPCSMNVIARLQNFPAATPSSIDWNLNHISELGINKVVFAMDQVLGFSGLTQATADSLKRHGMVYGPVEFGKQKGDEKLSDKLRGQNMVRVHSISSAEIWTLTPATAVERYVRAARERNIRLLYIRLFDAANEKPLQAHKDYIKSIVANLQKMGLAPGVSLSFVSPVRPAFLLILAGLGVAAGGVLLLASVFPLSARSQVLLSIAGFAAVTLLTVKGGTTGLKLVALLSALIFPVLAFTIFQVRAREEERAFGSGSVIAAVPVLAGISAVTLTGGLMIAGILGELPFMLRVNQFMGIKAAHLLPILAIMAIYIGDAVNRGESWSEYKHRVKGNFNTFFKQPTLIWQLLVMGITFGILALLLLRSGNDAGVGVSSLELKFRAILDRILLVRPRSKEFLFGHPALLSGIALASAGRRRWVVPLVVAGSVGQVSLLNTFCHIHSPLTLSALRAFNGLVTGILITLVAAWIVATAFPGLISDPELPVRTGRESPEELARE